MSDPLFIDTGLPAWMEPPKQSNKPPFSKNTWEEILNRLAAGEYLIRICEEPNMPDYGYLLRYIHGNEKYTDEYYTAREAGGLHHMDMELKYAHGGETNGVPNDVQRDQLICRAHRNAASIFNRKRFGEKQQIDVNHTVDLGEAMQKALERVEQRRELPWIDGEVIDE